MRSLLTLLLLSSTALATDITVPAGGDIQAAMDQALPGDRVLVSAGTYQQTIDFHGKAIEVLGMAGANQTILDGGGAGTVASFKSGEGPGSRLTGVTLTGGNGGYGGGGGIGCSSGSTPVITDCIVRGNSGKLGAGVAGSPTMERCVITANTSSLNHGGGLYGAPTLMECVVALNSATSADGGGLYVKGGKSLVVDSLFLENRAIFANSHGGGIYVDSTGDLELRSSLLVGNYSTGGAFAGYGGAMRVESPGTTVEGCTIIGNSVSGSSTMGGGIYGPAVVHNSIVRDNVGGDLELATATWCDVSGGYPGIGNVDLSPGFVDEANRDFHLGHGSPVIDLGDPSSFDPDGTRADLGAFPFASLYARGNTSPADWDTPSWSGLSSVLGGQVRLRVLAGAAAAGDLYWILGSASGNTPGFDLAGTHVPLNFDSYTLMTLTQPNGPGLAGFLGVLGPDGTGDATLSVPADLTGSLAGTTASHAAIFGQPGGFAPPVTTVADVVLP